MSVKNYPVKKIRHRCRLRAQLMLEAEKILAAKDVSIMSVEDTLKTKEVKDGGHSKVSGGGV